MENEQQPIKESKLKTILLGTPEQREARTEKYTSDIKNKFWTSAAKTIMIPGYLTNLTLYVVKEPGLKSLMTVATLAMEYQRIHLATTIAAKLGEYFS